MTQSQGRMLWLSLKCAAYAALAIALASLALALVAKLPSCQSLSGIYPDYCWIAGLGMFVFFMYALTLAPAMLAILGAVLFVLDLFSYWRRVVARRSSASRELTPP